MTTTKRPYAEGTDVPVDRTLADIKAELAARGVTKFGYGQDGNRVVLGFTLEGRNYVMRIIEPDPQDFPRYRAKNNRWVDGEVRLEQERRRKWRVLYLHVKAALVLVDEKMQTAAHVFQAYALLPDGRTAGDWLEPQLKHAYETGQMPPLLPMLIAGTSDITGDDA